MATAREWAEGYYRQAQAELTVLTALLGNEPSVVAMLMQMVMEKLGKAALLRGGVITVDRARTSHASASTMMQQLGRNKGACQRLGYHPATVRSLTSLVDQLERSHPSLAIAGPHLEYPWEAVSGVIEWPAAHLGVAQAFRAKSSQGVRLLALAARLCERFDQVFP